MNAKICDLLQSFVTTSYTSFIPQSHAMCPAILFHHSIIDEEYKLPCS
jgi:hypothetical protein